MQPDDPHADRADQVGGPAGRPSASSASSAEPSGSPTSPAPPAPPTPPTQVAPDLDPGVAGAPLTDRQRAIIEFEGTWWTHDDARDSLIRARFACSSEDYYQELNQLLDHPSALTFDPLVVRRLRRQRERRRRARIDGPNATGTAPGESGGKR